MHAGFLSYEHAGPAPDFVFTRNALHQLPDFWKGIALARIAALLRPGGLVRLHDLVFDFEPADAAGAIAAWVAGAVDDPARGWTAAELAEHVRLEHSTYSWLFEPLLRRTGFEILDVRYQRGGLRRVHAAARRVSESSSERPIRRGERGGRHGRAPMIRGMPIRLPGCNEPTTGVRRVRREAAT